MACSIGVTYRQTPVVGVIALPFMNQIVRDRQRIARGPVADDQKVLSSSRGRCIHEQVHPSTFDLRSAAAAGRLERMPDWDRMQVAPFGF